MVLRLNLALHHSGYGRRIRRSHKKISSVAPLRIAWRRYIDDHRIAIAQVDKAGAFCNSNNLHPLEFRPYAETNTRSQHVARGKQPVRKVVIDDRDRRMLLIIAPIKIASCENR